MIIIGEKINGTIPSVKTAIAGKDTDFIKSLAVKQSESGAAYIDACASVAPEIEIETLGWLMDLIQDVTDTPLCIDSPNPNIIKAVFEKAGKPGLINSVSCEGNKLDIIFPMIAETEWECVVLLCDNDGIPESVEKRLKIAEKIIGRAIKEGISPGRLHIDPLVMALSTDDNSMTKFMECTREIKKWYPEIHITSGLSNISFGLPLRKSINQYFLALAMSVGMDSAIMDPLNQDLMSAIYITDALLGRDRCCRKYTTAYRKGKIGILK